jgi:FAD/FMN-containing dehydrogenase
VVGVHNVLVGSDVVSYSEDWTGRWRGTARFVVRPGDQEETREVVRLLVASCVPFVPQGGNTGLVAGATPLNGEAVLSTRRLASVKLVGDLHSRIEVGAGVSLEGLQGACPLGWEFPVDLAARGSATIGGMIATNAGGLRSVRYGRMRKQVIGLNAVLADGSEFASAQDGPWEEGDSAVESLLIGSEGVFGIVTSACLQLAPRLEHRVAALVAIDGLKTAIRLVDHLRPSFMNLDSLEYIDGPSMRLFCSQSGVRCPVRDVDTYLLIECAGASDPSVELASALQEAGLENDVAVGTTPTERARLWQFRDGQTESIARAGIPHKLDIEVPRSSMSAMIDDISTAVKRIEPTSRMFVFGHIGVGNLHVNLLGLRPEDESIDRVAYEIVSHHGGNIAAEHGIGRAKMAHFAEIEPNSIRSSRVQLKSHVDPETLCNPGVGM